MVSNVLSFDEKTSLVTQKLIKVLETKALLLESYVSLQNADQRLKNTTTSGAVIYDLKSSFSKEIEIFAQALRDVNKSIAELNAGKKLIEGIHDSI